MDEKEILELFKETNAFLKGHFLLSSGLHSSGYLQCALLLQNPRIAESLCTALASKFRKEKPSIVVAPALGGIIVSHEVARSLGIKGIFTERKEGKMCLRRGFSLGKNDRVLIVEDVITTGSSTKEVMEVVTSHGSEIIGIGSIVDRSNGKAPIGVNYKSLIKINIPIFNPTGCPLCKKKIPLVKPGSRKIK